MTTRVEVSKARIIKAIKTEPLLRPGAWVEELDSLYQRIDDETQKEINKYVKKEKISEANLAGEIYVNIENSIEKKFQIVGNKKDCVVCAVGSVFREILDKDQPLSFIGAAVESELSKESERDAVGSTSYYSLKELEEQAIAHVTNKNYMVALSHYFESLCNMRERWNEDLSRHQMYRIRLKVVDFVRKHFPNKIVLDIDGAKPAKDVKVVKGKK